MENEKKFCPNCGSPVEGGKFCPNCGQDLSVVTANGPEVNGQPNSGNVQKMTPEQIRQILVLVQDKVPEEKLMFLKSKLAEAPASKFEEIMCLNYKEPVHILLFSIFLGGFGVDRFILGDTGLGIAKIFLNWLTCGIWSLVDIFLCYKKAKEMNLNKILMLA